MGHMALSAVSFKASSLTLAVPPRQISVVSISWKRWKKVLSGEHLLLALLVPDHHIRDQVDKLGSVVQLECNVLVGEVRQLMLIEVPNCEITRTSCKGGSQNDREDLCKRDIPTASSTGEGVFKDTRGELAD